LNLEEEEEMYNVGIEDHFVSEDIKKGIEKKLFLSYKNINSYIRYRRKAYCNY
jgi:hypothetical protein